jgi:Protein of unknown function (DUF3015)
MRKLVLAAAVLAMSALPATSAFADATGAGCGVGTMIFKGQKGVIPQVLAVTTNGSFGNQTFGMSTGTLGCEQDGVVMREHEKEVYVAANMDQIKLDMARGGGEYLATLASLMAVAPADQPAFFTLTKDRFADVAGPVDSDAGALLARLDQALAADPVLARYAS